MENKIGLNGFIQIALVVEDIEEAAKAWADLFGVPVPPIRDDKPSHNPNLTYRGQEAYYGLKFAVIDCRERGFVIELHEPDEHPSTFREFLDKHGNGVHHIGFEVGERRDAIVNELEQQGYALRTVGYYPGSSWTIVDTEDTLGVNLNIKPKA